MKKKQASCVNIIHEYDEKGRHRIVRIGNGVVEEGHWVPYNYIAELGALRAATDFFGSALPEGVFTIQQREHSELTK